MTEPTDAQDAASELLARIEQQETELVFPGFSYADAWSIGSRLVELGTERGLPIAISIVLGRQRVFHAALSGSSADNDDWIARKLGSVFRFGHASYWIGTAFRTRGGDFVQDNPHLDLSRFAGAGGGFPIRIGEIVVGAIGVSGLPEADDHALVVQVIREHLTRAA